MKLNKTEARILLYLNNVSDLNKNVTKIRDKLDVEYSYLCRTLRTLYGKGLLKRIVSKGGKNNKVVYTLLKKGENMLPIAKKVLK